MHTGEIIALATSALWTVTALCAEVASRRLGSLPMNVVRMALTLALLALTLWAATGAPYPTGADGETWLWLSLSGLVGFVIGDFCLFNCYILIGSRLGQLLMTLAPPSAAVAGLVLLGERLYALALLGMAVTLLGIALSIYHRSPSPGERRAALPLRGVLYGVGAAMGQGVGLVFSARGLRHYADVTAALPEHGLLLMLPFAATMIRAVTGLAGFALWTTAAHEWRRLWRGLHDLRAQAALLGATVTGPFLGVSLSLLATRYTATGIAQTLMALTPVLILWPSHVLFRQRVTWREVAGAMVAVAGVALFFV